MTNKMKFFSIKSFEWLPPIGDGSRILVLYSLADDNQGIKNTRDLSIVINFSRNAENKLKDENISLANRENQTKVIIDFLRGEIRNAISSESDLPKEMGITSYENRISKNPDSIELLLGEWEEVEIVRKMGFLSI